MESDLIVAIDRGVARLKLNRPETRNALTRPLCAALRAALADIERQPDPGSAAVVIEGCGGAFASGADIAELDRLRTAPAELLAFYRDLRATQELVYGLERITIAAIDGYCMGAGLSLALACDLRVATPRSVFSAPPAKLGLLYSEREVSRLANRVGGACARDLLFTGRRVAAEEASRLGLIERLATADALDSAVNGLIEQLQACSPAALRKTKAQLLRLERQGAAAMTGEQEAEEAFFQPDAAEGISAFLAGRPPRFTS
jgi:enoyl-CoA hydratase/carnithine racemase